MAINGSPAQIYARAMTFYPNQYLSKDEVLELKRLNYAEVNRINNTGQYVVKGNTIRIFRRALSFTMAKSQKWALIVFGEKSLLRLKMPRGNRLVRRFRATTTR